MRDKYGRDPSNLFPLEEGPRHSAELTHEEGEAVDFLIDELGFFSKKSSAKTSSAESSNPDDRDKSNSVPARSPTAESKKLQSEQNQLKEKSLKPKQWLPEGFVANTSSEIASSLSLFSETETSSINDNSTHTAASKSSKPATDPAKKAPPKHLLTVWDYNANYGGELYTVQWESELLMECELLLFLNAIFSPNVLCFLRILSAAFYHQYVIL